MAQHLLSAGLAQFHVSMGQLLRDVHQEATQSPDQHQKLIEVMASETALEELGHCLQHGLLIPDAWTEAIIELYLKNHPELQTSVWLLDGYPRRLRAARHLLSLLEQLNIPVLKVIHLQVPESEVLRRSLARKRADDTAEAIRTRYQLYLTEILPAIQFLETQLGTDWICQIDAVASRETIQQKAVNALSWKPSTS